MENIHIRVVSIDELAGLIFLQFATDETLPMIEQSTMHGFFPAQYPKSSLDELFGYMAEFGRQILEQQVQVQQNKLSAEQVSVFESLLGQIKAVKVPDFQSALDAGGEGSYNPDGPSNTNGQIDQFRNLILEVLAEEGLIPGGVK